MAGRRSDGTWKKSRKSKSMPISLGVGSKEVKEKTSPDYSSAKYTPKFTKAKTAFIKKGQIGEPQDVFKQPRVEIHEGKSYRILISFPDHERKEIDYRVKDDILIVRSLKPRFRYHKEFLIPKRWNVATMGVSFRNGLLELQFNKKLKKNERQKKSKEKKKRSF